eukprot:scaffold56830_cov33-Phaeocystis_antarctica.AAC.1
MGYSLFRASTKTRRIWPMVPVTSGTPAELPSFRRLAWVRRQGPRARMHTNAALQRKTQLTPA